MSVRRMICAGAVALLAVVTAAPGAAADDSDTEAIATFTGELRPSGVWGTLRFAGVVDGMPSAAPSYYSCSSRSTAVEVAAGVWEARVTCEWDYESYPVAVLAPDVLDGTYRLTYDGAARELHAALTGYNFDDEGTGPPTATGSYHLLCEEIVRPSELDTDVAACLFT